MDALPWDAIAKVLLGALVLVGAYFGVRKSGERKADLETLGDTHEKTVASVEAVEKARGVAPARGRALVAILRKRDRKLGKAKRTDVPPDAGGIR